MPSDNIRKNITKYLEFRKENIDTYSDEDRLAKEFYKHIRSNNRIKDDAKDVIVKDIQAFRTKWKSIAKNVDDVSEVEELTKQYYFKEKSSSKKSIVKTPEPERKSPEKKSPKLEPSEPVKNDINTPVRSFIFKQHYNTRSIGTINRYSRIMN